MNIFELLIVQPIFNILAFIYGIIPGIDFGVAIILFTILIRMALWPLVKKQLHQTKAMRKIQPELAKIKKKAAGNKQLESQLMMELYRENGVNPFGTFGLLLLQLPILLALYQVITLISHNVGAFSHYSYGFIKALPRISDVIAHHNHFNDNLFGFIDLTKHALEGGFYAPIFVFAIAAAVLQYFQAKQVSPQTSSNRKLRDVLKDQAGGKSVEQSEVTALVSKQTLFIFPILTFFIALALQGAVVLYYAVTSLVAVIQQSIILGRDEEELEKLASTSPDLKVRVRNAQEAEIVEDTTPQPKVGKKRRRKR